MRKILWILPKKILGNKSNLGYSNKQSFPDSNSKYNLKDIFVMKSVICAFLATLIFGVIGFGQNVTPTSTPPADDSGDVVKISTSLIQLDVTVTDKKGDPITDLRPDEIEIYENGKKQKINNLSFISNIRERAESGNQAATPVYLPPGTVKPEQIHRTIALVVDDLTLSFSSIFWVRKALKKFIDEEVQEGDLVAVIRTAVGSGTLQQFTTNKQQLYAAVDNIKFNMSGTAMIGTYTPITPTLKEVLNGTKTSSGVKDLTADIAKENASRLEIEELRESIFTTGTLGSINYIVRGMQDLPGRKSIVLLSDGFSYVSRDSRGYPHPNMAMSSLRALTDQANRASVVIYTLDARGLVAPGLRADDDTSGLTSGQIDSRLTERENSVSDTQDGLKYLARETGGIAFYNQNSLNKGLRQVMDDQSYYLVGYLPDDETFDPKVRQYNKLEVKVLRPDAKVRYRSGFFAIVDSKREPQRSGDTRLMNALLSPFAVNDISLRLNSLFTVADKDKTFLRSLLHFGAGELKFERATDGQYESEFDLVAMSFGETGVVSDQLSKTFTITLDETAYQKYMEKGFVYNFIFPIEKAGAYQLRVAIRDHNSDKVGSASQFVQVPNLKKGKLILSSAALENLNAADLQRRKAGLPLDSTREMDPWTATALRRFKAGTVLNYAFEIFNPKLDSSGKPDLTVEAKIYKDGVSIFDGQPQNIPTNVIAKLDSVDLFGSINLGSKMEPGDYILQLEITDQLSGKKNNKVSQFVQFEIIE